MSTNPSTFNAIGFNRAIRRNVELKGGNMRAIARMATGDLYREKGIYPVITGGGLPSKITTRAPTTPNSEATYGNRAVTRADYHDATINMDRQDLDRMVVDPRSEKFDILMQKFRRLEDLVYMQAAIGTAKGGDAGATDVAFPTANIIDVTLGALSGKTNGGFNYEKMKASIAAMGKANVDITMKRPEFVLSWSQWEDMAGDDKFINRDYVEQNMVLGRGVRIPNYMGCGFILTEMLPYMNTAGTGFRIADSDISAVGGWTDTDTTDIRACVCTVSDTTLLEIKPEIITKSGENPSLSYRHQVYLEMGLGAVRMEEITWVVPCDQSPA